jgi:hypothetical protein
VSGSGIAIASARAGLGWRFVRLRIRSKLEMLFERPA